MEGFPFSNELDPLSFVSLGSSTSSKAFFRNQSLQKEQPIKIN